MSYDHDTASGVPENWVLGQDGWYCESAEEAQWYHKEAVSYAFDDFSSGGPYFVRIEPAINSNGEATTRHTRRKIEPGSYHEGGIEYYVSPYVRANLDVDLQIQCTNCDLLIVIQPKEQQRVQVVSPTDKYFSFTTDENKGEVRTSDSFARHARYHPPSENGKPIPSGGLQWHAPWCQYRSKDTVPGSDDAALSNPWEGFIDLVHPDE